MNNRGADISHRGGVVGFISINEKGQLLAPDYVGNGFFNTLGNLSENPIASLLFCDWQHGHALQIKVSTEILWSEPMLDNIKTIVEVKTKSKTKNKVKEITERTLCFTPLKIETLNNSLAYRLA